MHVRETERGRKAAAHSAKNRKDTTMRHLKKQLSMGISPTLVLAMLVFAASGSAQMLPQTTAPEDMTDEAPSKGLITTVLTITAPDGSESVHADRRPIENTTVQVIPSLCQTFVCSLTRNTAVPQCCRQRFKNGFGQEPIRSIL